MTEASDESPAGSGLKAPYRHGRIDPSFAGKNPEGAVRRLYELRDRWNSQSLAAQFLQAGGLVSLGAMIVVGMLGCFYDQFVLVDQPFVRDDKMTISQLVAQASAKTGENVQISRFVRFLVGECAE